MMTAHARPTTVGVRVALERNATPASTNASAVFGTISGRPGAMLRKGATPNHQPANTAVPTMMTKKLMMR